MKNKIRKLIETTRRVIPGYWESTLAQRAGLEPKAAGSIYEGLTSQELQDKLLETTWEEYSHPAVIAGCQAFKGNLGGRLGIINLKSLDPEKVVTLDDRKNTGKVSVVIEGIRGPEVDFTILIIGPEKGEDVIYTFHPGDPIKPSTVEATTGLHNKRVSIREALEMGFEMGKII